MAPTGGCSFSLFLAPKVSGPTVKADIGMVQTGGEQFGSFDFSDVPAGTYVLQEDTSGTTNCKGAWSATVTSR